MVGAVRFELTTSCTRNKRASQATLRPDEGAKNAVCTCQLQSRNLGRNLRGLLSVLCKARRPCLGITRVISTTRPVEARQWRPVVGHCWLPPALLLALAQHQEIGVICRDSGVNRFRALVSSGAHRDAAAAINSWFKLTLPGDEQRLTLVEQGNAW